MYQQTLNNKVVVNLKKRPHSKSERQMLDKVGKQIMDLYEKMTMSIFSEKLLRVHSIVEMPRPPVLSSKITLGTKGIEFFPLKHTSNHSYPSENAEKNSKITLAQMNIVHQELLALKSQITASNDQNRKIQELVSMSKNKKANGIQASTIGPITISKIKYNKTECILTIGNVTIDLCKSTNQARLCRAICQNSKSIKRKWNVRSILKEIGEHDIDGFNWNSKFYSAARHLNTKILKKTGIDDFLSFDTIYFQVNKKYI